MPPSTAWATTPPTKPPLSQTRSPRRGARKIDPKKAAITPTVKTTVTRRFPNSTSPWNWSAGVRWPTEHSGQSAQPRPEPVRRTAAPVSTMRAVRTRATTSSRWLSEGETVGVRRRDTPGKRTGARRLVPGEPLAVGCTDMSIEAPALPGRRAKWSRSTVGAYIALTKPRIIELLLVTTLPTMVVAQRGVPPIWLMVATLAGGALAAGGANAINMVVDRDIDRLMNRTKNRPLVTGAMTPTAALAFALAIEVAAFVELWLVVNLLSAVLAISATLFYVFVYTLWLKRRSTQNIVIGGAAGAVPVLVGWAAVTDSLAWAPVVLFAIIFIWTPPHFWSLAVRYKEDYRAADVPMLPVVASMKRTTTEIVYYSVLLVAVSLVLAAVARLGVIYIVSASVLGVVFLALALRLWRRATPKAAMQLFSYSITYLTLLFVLMAVDIFTKH